GGPDPPCPWQCGRPTRRAALVGPCGDASPGGLWSPGRELRAVVQPTSLPGLVRVAGVGEPGDPGRHARSLVPAARDQPSLHSTIMTPHPAGHIAQQPRAMWVSGAFGFGDDLAYYAQLFA